MTGEEKIKTRKNNIQSMLWVIGNEWGNNEHWLAHTQTNIQVMHQQIKCNVLLLILNSQILTRIKYSTHSSHIPLNNWTFRKECTCKQINVEYPETEPHITTKSFSRSPLSLRLSLSLSHYLFLSTFLSLSFFNLGGPCAVHHTVLLPTIIAFFLYFKELTVFTGAIHNYTEHSNKTRNNNNITSDIEGRKLCMIIIKSNN